jgi:cytoskeleton protein RodZ
MNMEAVDDRSENQAPEGPGRRLKASREAQQLDLGRVASLLHLSEEKLRLLEAEDYGELPGPVFVQGYIRNYARLLGVPVEPLITAFRNQSPEGSRQPELRISQVRHEVHSSHLLVRLVTWAIVFGLVALVFIWWRGYLQWPMKYSPPGVNQDQESLLEPPEGAGGPGFASMPSFLDSAGDEEASDDGTLAIPDMELRNPDPSESGAEIEATTGDTSPQTGPTPETMPQETLVEESKDAAAGEQSQTAGEIPGTTPPRQTPATEARVVVQFNGKSWSRIRDATGRFKVQEEMVEGTRLELKGTPPYDLVLGNATVVEIWVDGEVFDLTPHLRGNVARFTLDPDKI